MRFSMRTPVCTRSTSREELSVTRTNVPRYQIERQFRDLGRELRWKTELWSGCSERIVYNLPSIANNKKESIGTRRENLRAAAREVEADRGARAADIPQQV